MMTAETILAALLPCLAFERSQFPFWKTTHSMKKLLPILFRKQARVRVLVPRQVL